MKLFILLSIAFSLAGCQSSEEIAAEQAATAKVEAFTAFAAYVNEQAVNSNHSQIFVSVLNHCGGMATVESMNSTSCLMALSTLEARDRDLQVPGYPREVYLAFAKYI